MNLDKSINIKRIQQVKKKKKQNKHNSLQKVIVPPFETLTLYPIKSSINSFFLDINVLYSLSFLLSFWKK